MLSFLRSSLRLVAFKLNGAHSPVCILMRRTTGLAPDMNHTRTDETPFAVAAVRNRGA